MRQITKTAAAVFALAAVLLAGCGKSEFGMSENSEKRMVITAENADKDSFFAVGTLYVEEGEQVEITADLSKGAVRVELFSAPTEGSKDELPEMDGTATITADMHSTEGMTTPARAGGYMMKATCLEKATGTVVIEAKPAP